jgi:F1F0 ATPase subunit 2
MTVVQAILVLLIGGILGVLFFGGLWLTVRALPTARFPTFLVLASFWGRTALVVAGFAVAMSYGWQNAIVCLLGFLVVRFLFARWVPDGTAG